MKKSLLILTFFLIVIAVFSACTKDEVPVVDPVEMDAVVNVDTFYDGITLDGHSLNGLTLAEAEALFDNIISQKQDEAHLYILHGVDRVVDYDYQALKFVNNYKEKLQELYDMHRTGDMESRYNNIIYLKNNGYSATTETTIDPTDALTDLYAIIQNDFNIEPVDGSIEYDATKWVTPETDSDFMEQKAIEAMFTVTESTDGIKLDPNPIVREIRNQLDEFDFTYYVLEPEVVPAEIQSSELATYQNEIAHYSTPYYGSGDRMHNVRTALGKISGHIIMPGEEFSFNTVVGPRQYDTGFREAFIILNGGLILDYGGGVCQSSSTTYNALLLAGCEIVDRAHHSFPVSYVPLALDATVTYGSQDLVMRNPHDYPLYLRYEARSGRVYMYVYGKPFANGGYYESSSRQIESEPAPEMTYKVDTELEYTTEAEPVFEFRSSRPKRVVEAYLTYYEDGKDPVKVTMYTDTYRKIEGITYTYPEPTPEPPTPTPDPPTPTPDPPEGEGETPPEA